MSHRLFVLDVPENAPIIEVARGHSGVSLDMVGPYFVISAEGPVVVDRRATKSRHAVWYSWIGGLQGWRIDQWNGDQLRLVPR
jgi:hypothetical protein